MSVRALIADHVRRLRAERSLPEVEITDDIALLDEGLGLDSLDVATLVAVLEKEVGKDPFVESIPAITTFGRFVALYE